MAAAKTTRARKARRSSTCPACRAPIVRGDLIASTAGRPWTHVDCPASADRAAAAVAARFGRPVDTLRSL